MGVLADDPTDPGPTLIAFAAGGTIFFAAMFGAVAWIQFRRTEVHPAVRSSLWIARAYTVLGILVTALALAMVWQQALGGGDVRVLLYPMIGIVVLWAAAVPWVLRRVRDNARALEADASRKN